MKKVIKRLLCFAAVLSLISCTNNQISSSVINSSVIPDNSGSLISSEPLPSSVTSDKPSSITPSSKTSVAPSVPSSEIPSSQAPSSESVNSVPVSSTPVQSSAPISSEPVSSSAPISSAPVLSSEQPSSSTPKEIYYHVTFVNYDETLLYEVDVLEGAEAVYQGEEPTKPEDNEFKYEFEGWDQDLSSITSDLITKAVFKQIDKINYGPIIWF